ncbi:carboxypeptidase-like regulatory domain-containing protein [Candidatus Methylomirabilis sp.]|uniref:Carboxypeptidase-like regulatory domain-containing protein n=1 Tax=Candidatus Methylomirabilis tolerans TaxID=3123416 RepID=A0AAJ1AKI3_9BACT|nr:carboxypeptidase-like regulatory domain-containing protein [Candidatus Methylomirabilis sp.]
MLRTGWHMLRFTGTGILLTATLAFIGPISADAGLVSGRVNDTKGKFQAGGTFRVKDSEGKVVNDRVKTDERGGYSIFLPPGIYTVEFSDGRGAVIQSHPEPLQQNIYLK